MFESMHFVMTKKAISWSENIAQLKRKKRNNKVTFLRDVSPGISFFMSRKEFVTYEQQYKTNFQLYWKANPVHPKTTRYDR